MSYTVGKHAFKAGIDARRVRYADIETFLPSDDFGQFTFQPTFTGNAFGDFLEGAPTTLFFAVSSPDVARTAWQYAVFAQDTYQISSRLTLSYGLRWQILPGFHEDGGNLANFDQRNNAIVVPDELASYLAKQNIEASNLAFRQSFNACDLNYTALPCTQYLTASQDHLPQSLRNTYKGNFQPRFGQGRAFLNEGGWKNALFGGLELNNVTLLETLPWLTASISPSSDQSNTNVVNRSASLRPDQVSNRLYQGQSRAQYFHTNFAPPATQIDNTTTFGVLSAPQTAENAGNRTGQVALRLDF